MTTPLFASPGDEPCGRRHPAADLTCGRPKGHDVCVASVPGGSDFWVADHVGTRRAVAEEIAAAIEAELQRVQDPVFRVALATAAGIARKVGEGLP
jgi:hypothetical protein